VIFLQCFLLLTGSSIPFWARTPAQTEKQALTNADIGKLSRSGLPDAEIVKQIRCSPIDFDTTPVEVKRLKSEGVTSVVIKEMIDTQKRRTASSVSQNSSTGRAAPHNSNASQTGQPSLTPQQLEAQERITERTHLSVPLPGENKGSARPAGAAASSAGNRIEVIDQRCSSARNNSSEKPPKRHSSKTTGP
jgi:hypothetical protein